MDAQVISSVIALSGVFVSVIASTFITKSIQNRKEIDEEDRALFRFIEPLRLATIDLKSRIINIIEKDFAYYYKHGTERQKTYYIESTIFRIAQFFALKEIARANLYYVKKRKSNISKIYEKLEYIERRWAYHKYNNDLLYCFSDEQKEIGGYMIEINHENIQTCIKYSDFRIKMKEGRFVLIDALRQQLADLSNDINPSRTRLDKLKVALADLEKLISTVGSK